MKQTVTSRYQVGESVALSDASLLMYHGFDQALKRDVWVEIYQIPNDNDNSEKQVIYDCIREQVLLASDWLRNLFDVYDDDGNVYVVGESLRNYVPLSTFLRQETDPIASFSQLLCALSRIIEFSVKYKQSFTITMDRILVCSGSLKLIPQYQVQKQEANCSKFQAFEILQQVYQSLIFPIAYQNTIAGWLQHAEKHGKIIDVVDIRLWMEELQRKRSTPIHKTKSLDVPSKTQQMISHQKEKPIEADSVEHDQITQIDQGTHYVSRKRIWVWTLVSALCLCIIGIIGYNWLNPTVAIPDLRGESYLAAVQKLHSLGIDNSKIERVDSYTTVQKPGNIYEQDPIPNSRIRLSSVVVLRVSKGMRTVTLPNVIGMSEQNAKDSLVKAGILPDQISIQKLTAAANSDLVVNETPPFGKNITENQTVTLTLGATANANASVVTIPNLIGLSLKQATDVLLKSGIHYEYRIKQASVSSGTVFEQSVKPGKQIDKNNSLTFFIAR